MLYIAFLDSYFWYLVLLVFGLIGIWSYWYSILLVFDLTGIRSYWYSILVVFDLIGIWSYWYLVLLVFVLIGIWSYWYLVLSEGFSKAKHEFHGVGSPLGEIFEKRQPAKPRTSLFEDRLLSHSDTGLEST